MNIYLVGICGTGVGSLAGLLRQLGHTVRGSDEHVYPPMSEKLAEWGIEVLGGYDARHLEPQPDLVVIGNVIRVANPEAVEARRLGLSTLSMPEAVARFGIGDRHSIVVAGTHGKTSVTALCAHVLLEAGVDPSFLVGGALNGYPESFRAGSGPHFVIEGDEYDTAYFDKASKFLHYKPKTAIITSLEFDHADIFDSIEAVEHAFRGLIGRVPSDGNLVVWAGADRARRLIEKHARTSRVLTYDVERDDGVDLWHASYISGPDGLIFEPVELGESLGQMRVPLWGRFSALNVLAVIGALRGVGLDADAIRSGLASFAGVRRRLDVRGEPRGVTVVDDFGHHPTAVAETLAAAKTRWPGRRIWALFEPRSATTRRKVFQERFAQAFAAADRVVIASHERLTEIPEEDRFDPQRLAQQLQESGQWARHIPDVSAIVEEVAREAAAKDVVLIFSNGAFGGLIERLIAQLQEGPGQSRGGLL